jgi:predicted metal-dependent peptidase|tara:strand:- start:11709 stop:13160 length:1452 start_codon:yes stop_codon:yes gene_type:complete
MTEDEIINKIKRVRINMLLDHPFFGTLAINLKLEERNDLQFKSLATDGKNVYYDKNFVENLTEKELEFALGHEVVHCAQGQLWRRGDRDKQTWDKAMDYVTNILLKENQIGEMPTGCLYDSRYSKMSVERVYDLLEKRQQDDKKIAAMLEDGNNQGQSQQQQSSQGDSDSEDDDKAEDGNDEQEESSGEDSKSEKQQDNKNTNKNKDDNSGNDNDKSDKDENSTNKNKDSGDKSDNDEKDEESDSSGTPTDPSKRPMTSAGFDGHFQDIQEYEELDKEWTKNVIQAYEASQMQGTEPKGFERRINEILKPKLNWRTILKQYLMDLSASDYQFYPPHKKSMFHGIILPRLRAESLGEIAIMIDSSGSIGDKELQTFLSEINSILNTYDMTLHFFVCDAKVHSHEIYNRGDVVSKKKILGGGGTDFRPVFRMIEEKNIRPKLLIMFTDGFGTFPKEVPQYPTVWLLQDKYGIAKYVPFGQTIEFQ